MNKLLKRRILCKIKIMKYYNKVITYLKKIKLLNYKLNK